MGEIVNRFLPNQVRIEQWQGRRMMRDERPRFGRSYLSTYSSCQPLRLGGDISPAPPMIFNRRLSLQQCVEWCLISRGQAVDTDGLRTVPVDRRNRPAVLWNYSVLFGGLHAYGTKPSTLAISLPTRRCLSSDEAVAELVIALGHAHRLALIDLRPCSNAE